jgi:pimeloyl-ACP methyl ester carboxylesterase
MWSHHARFLNRLASFSRLILYDPRGWGCSDRVAPGETVELEDHVVDLIAVLDAANAGRPAMFVSTDMGEMGLLAAATHPERFQALVLFNVPAKEVGTPEEPFWGSAADYEAMVESVRRSMDWEAWSRTFVRDALPSHGADEEAIAWFSTMVRLTEAPGRWSRTCARSNKMTSVTGSGTFEPEHLSSLAGARPGAMKEHDTSPTASRMRRSCDFTAKTCMCGRGTGSPWSTRSNDSSLDRWSRPSPR